MPLIVRWPRKTPAGQVNEATVLTAVDFFPTFCKLAGLAVPDVEFDGEDLSTSFHGLQPRRTKPIYWEYGRDETYLRPGRKSDQSPNLAIREGRWKLLVNEKDGALELYDLKRDETEQANIASRHADVAADLSAKLLAWRESLP